MKRSLIIIAAIAAVASFGARAEAGECKAKPVVASGKPFPLKNLGAYQSSLFEWREAVKQAHGHQFNSWRYAEVKTVDCKQNADKQWVCTRSAIPCRDTLSKVIVDVKEKTDDLKDKIGDKVQKVECKADAHTSWGRRETDDQEASNQAVWGWRIDVSRKLGKEWATWENAKNADIDCRERSGGKMQCIAMATPCIPK